MKKPFPYVACLLVILLLSCGSSVVLTSTHGVPKPDLNERKDFFRDKYVVEVDTVLLGFGIQYDVLKTQRVGCESGKLHSVEFKQTFGNSLLRLITLGYRRKVTITYTCMQDL